jgi:hypothetical protein
LIYVRRLETVTKVWFIDIVNAPFVFPVVVYENVIEVLTFENWTGISRETREIRTIFRSGCCSGNDATNEELEYVENAVSKLRICELPDIYI